MSFDYNFVTLWRMDIKNYELIIFDCDGTLADSEMAHNTVLMQQLHAMGLTEYTIEKNYGNIYGAGCN
jgi:beta-phosphoglucomutase-like phosphatase (HAD superfamily)